MIRTTKNNLHRNADCFLLVVTEFGYSGIINISYLLINVEKNINSLPTLCTYPLLSYQWPPGPSVSQGGTPAALVVICDLCGRKRGPAQNLLGSTMPGLFGKLPTNCQKFINLLSPTKGRVCDHK